MSSSHHRSRPGIPGLALLVGAVLLGGCTTPTRSAGAGPVSAAPPSVGSPASTAPAPAPSPTAPAGRRPLSPTVVPQPTSTLTPLADVSPLGYQSVPWTLNRRGPRDTDVVATIAGLACRRIIGAHVALAPTTATIAVLAAAPRPGICADPETGAVVLIRAPEPIGPRQIRHARLGR